MRRKKAHTQAHQRFFDITHECKIILSRQRREQRYQHNENDSNDIHSASLFAILRPFHIFSVCFAGFWRKARVFFSWNFLKMTWSDRRRCLLQFKINYPLNFVPRYCNCRRCICSFVSKIRTEIIHQQINAWPKTIAMHTVKHPVLLVCTWNNLITLWFREMCTYSFQFQFYIAVDPSGSIPSSLDRMP